MTARMEAVFILAMLVAARAEGAANTRTAKSGLDTDQIERRG